MVKICEISAGSFDKEVLHEDGPIVVEFFSHSCPHCIKFAPVYAHTAETLDGEAQFVKIDVIVSEANRNLAHNRGVRTVPTIEVFYRGRVIGSIVGYHEIKKIEAAIRGFLSKKQENIGPGTSLMELK
jgi:thioredoxin-like negative regulator of GroEL